MGVADLWGLLKPAFDDRVSLKAFCSEFVSRAGRPPRIAIDANILLFQSAHRNIPSLVELRIVIRNFFSKLLAFVSLNISFVVVFDGKFKPHKLRNGPAAIGDFDFERDYEGLLEYYCSAHPLEYAEGFPLIEALRKELQKAMIDYIQAPAEAEAQCAYLQRHGVVDYVLTNDGDAFVFGATNVLRNFSRYSEDVAVSPSKHDKFQALDEYYVTPVRMARVEAEIGFDTWRLIFLVCLRGGDYSVGAKQIGIAIASKLALCGTVFTGRVPSSNAKTNLAVEIPDFVKLFRNCLTTEVGHQFFAPWAHIADAMTRVESLCKFETHLHAFVSANSATLFGRNITFANKIRICPDTALFYSSPFVDRRVYKFYPQTLSFAETTLVKNDLCLPLFHGLSIAGNKMEIVRTNSVYGSDDHKCGKLLVQIELVETGNVQVTENEFQGVIGLSLPYLSVAPSFSGKLKTIIGRLLSYTEIADRPILDYINVSRRKAIKEIDYMMIKYEAGLLHEVFPHAERVARESSPSRNESPSRDETDKIDANPASPSRLERSYIWLPQVMVTALNPHLVELFTQRVESPRKKSPKKSPIKPAQKTTLDHFGSFLESPSKRARKAPALSAMQKGAPPQLSCTLLDPITQSLEPPPQILGRLKRLVPLQLLHVGHESRKTQQQLSFSPPKNTPENNPFIDPCGPRGSQSDDDLLKLLEQVDENVLKFENSRKSVAVSNRPSRVTEPDHSVISINSSGDEGLERLNLTTGSQLIILSSQED